MADVRTVLPSLLLAAACALGTVALPALAQPSSTAGMPDPVLEQRVTHVAEQLRCLVCQNQSIADSHAQLALDLKAQVREQLAQGRSERDIIDFMVQRYGDFVLYRPPFKPSTWVLWLAPFLLLATGLLVLWLNLRARRLRAENDDDDDGDASDDAGEALHDDVLTKEIR